MRLSPDVWSRVIALVLSFIVVRSVAAAETAERVRCGDHGVTIHVKEAPLAEVLGELGLACNAEVIGEIPNRTVSADFHDVALAQALPRLLRDQSFAVIYGTKGRIVGIQLLEHSKTGSAPPAVNVQSAPAALPAVVQAITTQSAGAQPVKAPAPESSEVPMERPVELPGGLANALGSSTATVQDVALASINQSEVGTREQAQQALLSALNSDPEAAAAYYATLQQFEDATMAQLLRRMGNGHSADDLMTTLAQGSQSAELRQKASSVLEQLHRIPVE